MASGIQVFAPDGRLKLDTNTRITRILGRVNLGFTLEDIGGVLYVRASYHTDPALAQSGETFVHILTNQGAFGTYRGPMCGIENPTTIWGLPACFPDERYASALGGSFMTLIYGKW